MNVFKKIGKALTKVFGFGSSDQPKTTTRTIKPDESYRHTPTGKRKITKSCRVQRINGKTIIHQRQPRRATPKQMQTGHNKILSLHAMFIHRAGLTNALAK